MTAHVCRAVDPSCYRCDLGKDEERSSVIDQFSEAAGDTRARWSDRPASIERTFHLLAADLFDNCANALSNVATSCPMTTKEQIAFAMAQALLEEDE